MQEKIARLTHGLKAMGLRLALWSKCDLSNGERENPRALGDGMKANQLFVDIKLSLS